MLALPIFTALLASIASLTAAAPSQPSRKYRPVIHLPLAL